MVRLIEDNRIFARGELVLTSDENLLMRIPDEIRECTVFAATKLRDGKPRLGGTAFCYILEEHGESYAYIVTAKHNVEGANALGADGNFYLRVNVIDGGWKYLTTKYSDWSRHEDDTVDLAVLPIADDHSFDDVVDCRFFPSDGVVTDDQIRNGAVGIGDETLIVGLFKSHAGKERNIPIVRMGHIAAMPEEKVEAKLVDIDAYLMEVRSIGGLSGSPVFLCKRPADYRAIITDEKGTREIGYTFRLMGVVHGHLEFSQQQHEDYTSVAEVNAGIAMVIPVAKLSELLNQSELVEKRRDYDKKKRATNGAVED